MYRLEFSQVALDAIAKFKRNDLISFKKIRRLLEELQEHPREGTGHPEPLVGSDDRTYSRRINKKGRLIYDIYDEIVTVLVISAAGHYSDH